MAGFEMVMLRVFHSQSCIEEWLAQVRSAIELRTRSAMSVNDTSSVGTRKGGCSDAPIAKPVWVRSGV